MRLCAFFCTLWLLFVIVACTPSGNAQKTPNNASFISVTAVISDKDDEQDTADRANFNDNCDEIHPEAQRIAEDYDAAPEEVMEWFCTGIGFGEIKQAYRIHTETDTSVEDILALFDDGMEWGTIRAQLGAAPGDETDGEE
ncbi:MAG: putative conserved protein, contains LysM and FecR domains [Chloroflexi bacterium AL-W]|nr:putative conserved protein, contains LysM and FecR domains [Chloroflexi bacterium AL-N1]NOK70852.1 putative conserved protein, contains LysM and FecR domains [Chloroflexi bacterium AL-N10]NOK78412.1 putative conserved protein, contains LysM and FecR domains [Chloroflexi bacterium AL-N5]NOK85393.1 putative conserved protein, contains LysM and FecR domains [Chloroflexi bacterium AL-W]NOK92669.1 putative conserved protein, contains LysM and FecR domains [Chloroflexi bacterium AL-N15]